MIPVKPPTSAAMFVIVARSSTFSSETACPPYSMTFASASPPRTYGCARIASMKSLAVTFAGRFPLTSMRTVWGTRTRTSFVIHELKMSVVPTPKAMQPIAPECGVCESVPMMTCPGSA